MIHMFNCRSVPPKAWEHARQALLFYFSRRHGLSDAEDLAHETLAAILSREDYQFEKEEDFLKVCYGFASHILQAARREAVKFSLTSADFTLATPDAEIQRLKGAEINVYLNELLELGRNQLGDQDWQLIQNSSILEENIPRNSDPVNANNERVKLHRARKKLAKLSGWRKG